MQFAIELPLFDFSGNGSEEKGAASYSFEIEFTPTRIRQQKQQDPGWPEVRWTGAAEAVSSSVARGKEIEAETLLKIGRGSLESRSSGLCLARTPSEAKTAQFHPFVSELHLTAASSEI